MRSSEVQNLYLFVIRNKKLKFFAIGNGLRSNAFRTTQSAHSALVHFDHYCINRKCFNDTQTVRYY